MAQNNPITTRETLKQYCLRALGKPVIEINVEDDQVEDRIDEALLYYQEYHSDATKRTYLKHQITSSDVTNEYITLSSDIIFVSKIFPMSSSFGTSFKSKICDDLSKNANNKAPIPIPNG